ncbi:MAG: phasin family protein [Yoonia sp.]|nr:phasin family protein [Yoonia sp.]
MAKTSHETSVVDDAVALGEVAMGNLEDAGLGPLRWLGAAWFETATKMNNEVLRFVADRIKEDVKTQHALLHCKNAKDLQDAQLAFLKTAHDQYTIETGKIVNLGMEMIPSGKKGTKTIPI